MEENKKGVSVDIFGNEYVIKGDGNAEYIKEVAKYLDSKMREISLVISNVSSLKVAILAALNLADEVHKLKREKVTSDKTSEKVDALVQVMKGQGFWFNNTYGMYSIGIILWNNFVMSQLIEITSNLVLFVNQMLDIFKKYAKIYIIVSLSLFKI